MSTCERIINKPCKTNKLLEVRNLVREYLQARILESLQRSGAMIPLAFHEGTTLHSLFSNGRYSEDLDFALEGNLSSYDLGKRVFYWKALFLVAFEFERALTIQTPFP